MEDRQRYQQGGPLSTPRSARRGTGGPSPGQLTAAASPRSSRQTAYKASNRETVFTAAAAAGKAASAGAVPVVSGDRGSSGGRPVHSTQQQASTYTASLLKRQAASALHKPVQASTAAVAISKEAGSTCCTAAGSATHPQLSARGQQQQQHSQEPDHLASLATKLQGIGSYCRTAASAASARTDKDSPRSSQQHKQHKHKHQQQQQQPLHVCYGSRNSSSGSGSYATQASSRGALLSARSVTSVSNMPVADGQLPAAAAAAGGGGGGGGGVSAAAARQQQLPSAASGAASYSQQLTSALSMLSAVTAANTAAAAMLRAVASEASKTAGSKIAPLDSSSSSGGGSSGDLQGQPVVPPLRLASQQQQEVYQPVTARIRLAATQAVARTDRPAVSVPAALGEGATAHAEAGHSTAAAAAAAAPAAGPAGVPEATGMTSLLSILAATGSSCRDECTHTDLEAPNSQAGGIGYTKLRRLQTTSGAGTAAAAADVTDGGKPYLAEPTSFTSSGGTSSGGTGVRSSAGRRLGQQQQRQQQQQQQQRVQASLWTSEDVVMGWYHHSDDDDDDEDSCQQDTSCTAATAAACAQHPVTVAAVTAAAGPGQLSSPESLRPFLQQPFGSSAGGLLVGDGGMPLLTAPAGACRLLTASSGGIEYAKLLRTQAAVSPAGSPRHSRFQQQQQQQQPADEGHSGSTARICSKLVTGWYSSGLHSDSSCGNSPDAYYAADPQAPTRAMRADAVPYACGTTHCLVSSGGGGGTAPAIAEATAATAAAVPAVRASSSGVWSADGGSGWGLPPYHPALPGGPSGATPGSLALAVGATLGVGAPAILWQDGSQQQQQQGSSAAASAGGASSAYSLSAGGAEPVAVGTFDLRPCFAGVGGAPLLASCTRDASVTELLEASQAQIHNMESTLASMLQVAKRWTEGGTCEPVGVGESLRDRFSST